MTAPTPEYFLALPATDQEAILRAARGVTGRETPVLEKDVWVCWALEVLFERPGRYPMAFKGGTALSKAYGLIERFSEDVDITVSVPGAEVLDGEDLPTSANQRKKLGSQLTDELRQHVAELRVDIASKLEAFGIDRARADFDPDEDGTVLNVEYEPASGRDSLDYLLPRVKLEFGARNLVEPTVSRKVDPYLASVELQAPVSLPEPVVDVLAVERIFWEKATLAHDYCNRDRAAGAGAAERMSRHWYDLVKLSEGGSAELAYERLDQLHSVVKIKGLFYRRATSDYDSCTNGGLRLVPEGVSLELLAIDYAEMASSGMFAGEPPAFDDVIDVLSDMEERINSMFR